MARNTEALKHVAAGYERVETVPVTGDVLADTKALQKFGPVDAFFDISPPGAGKSTHFKSCMLALKQCGRVSLMGGIQEDLAIPHVAVVHRNLQLRGKWMYEREDIRSLIRMVEVGVLKLGERGGVKVVGKFGLEDWEQAFDMAAENAGMGLQTLITP